MKENSSHVNPRKEKTGFKINQKLLLVSLIAMAIIGTTYYWLDDRPDVYHPGWIVAGIIWYIGIISGIIFVNGKTRLGFIISGILSWITLAFWSFDNFYVVFDTSILSPHPNEIITLRNFIGIFVVIIAIVASHNTFHKVIDYQYKGKPI